MSSHLHLHHELWRCTAGHKRGVKCSVSRCHPLSLRSISGASYRSDLWQISPSVLVTLKVKTHTNYSDGDRVQNSIFVIRFRRSAFRALGCNVLKPSTPKFWTLPLVAEHHGSFIVMNLFDFHWSVQGEAGQRAITCPLGTERGLCVVPGHSVVRTLRLFSHRLL